MGSWFTRRENVSRPEDTETRAVRYELLKRDLEDRQNKMQKGGSVSRGPGRCQRAILAQLEAAPEGEMTRRQLEEALTRKGFTPSNILRSTRALVRSHRLQLQEGRDLDTSIVRLPPPPTLVSNAKLDEMLALLKDS
jgi:hypothetical protein